MLYSKTTQYAIRGLSELAAKAGTRGILLDRLVAGTDLPRDFLAKIFQKLVKAGLLASTRGRLGGFALARPAHAITLMQIITAVEGDVAAEGCVLGLKQCNEQQPCAQHDLYKPIRQRLNDYLTTTTLADLAVSLKSKADWKNRQDELPVGEAR